MDHDSATSPIGAGPGSSQPPTAAPAKVYAVPRWAWGALALFFTMKLLTSMDQWLLASVLQMEAIRDELKLSELQAGWLSTVLIAGLAGASLPVGYAIDRLRRPRLLAMGFAVWSVATIATGLARSYDQIQIARVLVGIGSATLEIAALTILMDVFPRSVRARVLAVFFLAVPLGAALGLVVGGAFARVATWQTAFLAVGSPGLLLALVALVLPDPVRGVSEPVDLQRLRLHEHVGPSQEDYIDMMVNSSYTYSVFGITGSSFVLAGLVYWSPTFLTVAKGLTMAQAEAPLGFTLLGAAILGTIAGGWLADWGSRTNPRVLFVLPGLAMFAAIAFVLVAIYGRTPPSIFGGLFLTEVVIFMNVVPCYTIIASVVMPNMRAVCCGAALASTHLLGDLWSPSAMGWAIDTFGQTDSMETIFGKALIAIGATPVGQPGRDPENLTAGMLVVIPALVIAGIVLLSGSRHLHREMALMLAKLRAFPSQWGSAKRKNS